MKCFHLMCFDVDNIYKPLLNMSHLNFQYFPKEYAIWFYYLLCYRFSTICGCYHAFSYPVVLRYMITGLLTSQNSRYKKVDLYYGIKS